MKGRTYSLFLLMLLPSLGVLLIGCKGQPAPSAAAPSTPPPLAVKALPAAVQEWMVSVPFSGSLRSRSVVEIKSEVAGRLIDAHLSEGDIVRKGQVVAEIDPTNYRLAHDQAVAALAVADAGVVRARVALDHARREKERADNLLRTGGITEKDHQAASTGVKESEAQLQLAEAQREQVRTSISITDKSIRDCHIVAPADGHVQKRYVDQGTLVAPAQPIYTIVDNARLELDCLIPSYRLAEIRPGLSSRFTTPTFGSREFTGLVSAINPMIESDNRSVRVALRINNPGGELRSGMFARGVIEVRRQPGALVIPRSALVGEQEDASTGAVYTVKDDTVHARPIKVGGIQDDRIWVQDGLQEGELIVVEIGPALKDGSLVKVLSSTSAVGQ
jgi:RND family efflux transporter MFP subunit